MKMLSLLALTAMAAVLTSCAPLNPQAGLDNLPRFHDGAAADAVVVYYGEQSVFLTRPDTRTGGFLPLMSHDTVMEQLSRTEIGRGLAVVVVGQMASADTQAATLDMWQADLSRAGFRRVVCLRSMSGGQSDRIDGLPILRDSVIALRADESAPFRQIAAVTPAP